MTVASGATVTVACKIPNGLTLRVGQFHEVDEPMFGGGFRKTRQWQQVGDPITIKGPKRGVTNDDPHSPAADGFALTFGVNAEFMEKWLKDNHDHDAVKNGLIRVHAKRDELKAMTREARDIRTGLEPLDPKGDTRVPKNITKMTRD